MASRPCEVELTVSSGRDLKNVNWRHGPNRPYVVAYVDHISKRSSRVDEEGDVNPVWNQTLIVPAHHIDEDSTLVIEIVHAGGEEGTKPLIGQTHVRLHHILEDVGFKEHAQRTLKLKRPSGRPHGKIDVKICIRYAPPPTAYPPPHHGSSYALPPGGYPAGVPPHPFSPPPHHGEPPQHRGYGGPPQYGGPPPGGFGGPPAGGPPPVGGFGGQPAGPPSPGGFGGPPPVGGFGGPPRPAAGGPPSPVAFAAAPPPAPSAGTPAPGDRGVPPSNNKLGFGAGVAAGAAGGLAGAFGGMALANALADEDSE